jgi:hypothetical protein
LDYKDHNLTEGEFEVEDNPDYVGDGNGYWIRPKPKAMQADLTQIQKYILEITENLEICSSLPDQVVDKFLEAWGALFSLYSHDLNQTSEIQSPKLILNEQITPEYPDFSRTQASDLELLVAKMRNDE